MSTSIPSQEYLSALQLRCGKGSGKEGDRCSIQERRAWSGLDPSSDEIPSTDSGVCGRFLIRFQDGIKDAELRRRLCAPLLVKLVGSKASVKVERERAWIAVDWVLREIAPMWLDLVPELAEHAAALRALPEIRSKAGAEAASQVRQKARDAAWQLRCTRLDELRKKSSSAAYAAAYAAADAAAAYAAAYAAADAAAYAADAYAYAEIREQVSAALRATSERAAASGARCLERMLDHGSDS